ncbi:hypothetical protein QBC44DRAFT_145599 [Cladorrhinum sp. PSN332]|nr:hypothetical protein QBC44DRAFT_145599 [Cladorrhinum sp. PSN332]
MDEAAAQRRIELQSPEDLTYLIANVRKAALDSINAAFPPVEVDGEEDATPEEDELRNQIEKLVNDYITQTFTLALPSLTINGFPLSTLPASSHHPTSSSSTSSPSSTSRKNPPQPEIQYTPFDSRKRDRIESLVSQEEDLLRSIASLKRRVPVSVSSAYLNSTNLAIQQDDEFLQSIISNSNDHKIKEEGRESGKKVLEGMGPLERQENVESSFREAVEGLARLKKNMPAVVAKMERAKGAGEYVNRGRK